MSRPPRVMPLGPSLKRAYSNAFVHPTAAVAYAMFFSLLMRDTLTSTVSVGSIARGFYTDHTQVLLCRVGRHNHPLAAIRKVFDQVVRNQIAKQRTR